MPASAEPMCPLTPVCNVDEHQTLICTAVATGHASGIAIEPSGFINFIPRGESGEVIQTSLTGAGSVGSSGKFTGLALLTEADDTVHLLVGNSGFDVASVDTVPPGSSQTLVNPLFMMPATQRAFSVRDEAGGTGLILLAGTTLWTTRVVGREISPPQVGGALTGTLSVLTTVRGQQVLRVTPDGQVDELKVNNGRLVVSHLADVTMPASEVAVGAWRWSEPAGDRLVVSSVTPGKVIGFVQHFYRSKEVLAESSPVQLPDSLRVVAGASTGGTFVCWPPEHEPTTLKALNLGAEAPWGIEKRAGDTCGLAPAARLALPGIGEFLLGDDFGLRRTMQFDNVGPWAPLAGGGFIGPRRLYDEGPLPVGIPSMSVGTGATVDLHGHGFWLSTGAGVALVGRTTRVFADPGGQSGVEIKMATPGGGVMVGTLAGNHRVSPEGVWTKVADVTVNGELCSVLPDGTVCGVLRNGTGSFCQPVTGPVITNTTYRTQRGCDGLRLADGTFMQIRGTRAWHVLGDASAVDVGPQPLDIDEIVFKTVDAEGTMWGIVRTTNNRWKAARFSVKGTEVIDDIHGVLEDPETANWLNSFIVDRHMVIVNPVFGTLMLQPRPPPAQ